jgi:hypothetical protein
MKRTTQGPMKGLKSMSKLSGTDKDNHTTLASNSKQRPFGRNRVLILESIAEKWSAMGLYKSSTRAMVALLGGGEQ